MHFHTDNHSSTTMPQHGGQTISRQGAGLPASPLLTRRELRRIVTDLIG